MKLYYHETSGGAKFLTDKFILCENGHKEGIVKGANYIVRIDGDITKDAELNVREDKKQAIPPLQVDGFTGGEWIACIDHSREAGTYPKTYIECNGKTIAKCYDKRWTISQQEAEANARLIAAAPDMYNALQQFVYYLDSDLSEAETILKERAIAILNRINKQ